MHDGRTLLYRASKHACDPCPLKLRYCPKEPARKIPRDVNEAARDLARGLMQTEGYRVSARQRKMIETGFADMKRNLGSTRLRLRGRTGANDDVSSWGGESGMRDHKPSVTFLTKYGQSRRTSRDGHSIDCLVHDELVAGHKKFVRSSCHQILDLPFLDPW